MARVCWVIPTDMVYRVWGSKKKFFCFWKVLWVRGDIANGHKMGRDAAECIWLTSSIWVVMLADMAKEGLDSYESRRPAILQVL